MVHHLNFDTFVKIHEPQLLSCDIPIHFWQSVYQKLTEQIFDAGAAFALLKIDYDDNDEREEYDPIWSLQLKLNDGLKCNEPTAIYLVDHAWTFRVDSARRQLIDNNKLLQRMAYLTGTDTEQTKEELVEKVYNDIWKYCNTYSVGNADTVEKKVPIWFIMDEVGSSIQHSDSPNFRAVPFIYVPEQQTYTLIFPIRDVEFAEHITRDYVHGVSEENDRKALLLPWVYSSFDDASHLQVEPDVDYFLSGHIQETLPDLNHSRAKTSTRTGPLKVYSEYGLVNIFLTDPRFEIVDNENDADVLWLTRHFKTYKELLDAPEKFINQFPYENILTVKDLLSVVCQRMPNNTWAPITYNLKTELSKFVAYYKRRQIEGLDNYWICKPWNLARSLDTHITNNLNLILRLPETGPKIAQKYIDRPVLFHRSELDGSVKFDIRYVVLLKSVQPLRVYAYKNFFLRFANRPFELNDFDVYEKHFTVMNYTGDARLKHLLCSEFIRDWQTQYPSVDWSGVEAMIFKMLKELFQCAVDKPVPCGLGESPQSRALYAADIMLEWTGEERVSLQPKLLEMNWTPDCKRACDYYKDFYNDIFALLFLDQMNNNVFEEL